MLVPRAHARLISWIAVLAILLSALAPSLGYALQMSKGGDWVEICSTQGNKWVQVGEEGVQHAPAMAHVLDHCPYCSLHAPSLGLPPATDWARQPSGLAHEVPLAFLAAPRTLHAWLRAQPRGPPLFS